MILETQCCEEVAFDIHIVSKVHLGKTQRVAAKYHLAHSGGASKHQREVIRLRAQRALARITQF